MCVCVCVYLNVCLCTQAIDTMTLEQHLSQYAFYLPVTAQDQDQDMTESQTPPGLAQLLQQLPSFSTSSQNPASGSMDNSSVRSLPISTAAAHGKLQQHMANYSSLQHIIMLSTWLSCLHWLPWLLTLRG